MSLCRKYNRSWAETNWWKCKLCPDSTPEIYGLNGMVDHNREVHKMATGFVCPVCDKTDFRKKGLLRAHVMTHNEDKKPCEVRETLLLRLNFFQSDNM